MNIETYKKYKKEELKKMLARFQEIVESDSNYLADTTYQIFKLSTQIQTCEEVSL